MLGNATGGSKLCVLAGGAYGTALAVASAPGFAAVTVWQVDETQASEIEKTRENVFFRPGVALPNNVHFTSSLEEAMADACAILSAIPTQPLSAFLKTHASKVPKGVPVISCSKGVNQDSLLFPHELWIRELRQFPGHPVGILSGPSFARELATGKPTAVTIYGPREHAEVWTEIARNMSHSASVRVFVSFDIMGAAVMGAAKNVLAILAGASATLGCNTRALVVALGIRELQQLAESLGSDGSAALGMAGLGDVVLTCTSEESRNYSVGKLLAEGCTLEDATKRLGLVEGVATIAALKERSSRHAGWLFDAVQALLDGRGVSAALEHVLADADVFE